ncbi:amidohydrolase [Marinifilum sp. D714]|uniref:amidohydrolase n=1 Tax=Marinifilum sp. D714 TaxID=2937523 RepID=UPI0027CE571F|nr:amidohydrolase [Marinifilum sp. D714]MDQ2178690.1 amidohydrolase [Marinifilum sp. D714]
MRNIIALRQELHKYPELSNKEFETSGRIVRFFEDLCPDKIIKLGPTGLAFVFEGKENGKTLMFRAELDALPIAETNNLTYASANDGVAHACGHDGHMAIISGLAQKITDHRPLNGKVVLLFQPAEEVEQGAYDVVNHPDFNKIQPDYIFALHNIPGEEKHKILIKEDSFAAASKGLTIKLFGKTSHAAEPENGINPANAISKIIQQLHQLRNRKTQFEDVILLTIIHIQLGDIAFGTSPGYAEIRLTLRSFNNNDMDLLSSHTEQIIKRIAREENLKSIMEYSEVFPATVNDKECVELIQESARENQLSIKTISKPFKWSEDFGYYTEKYKGGFFGIGAGLNQPALHNPNYNFPDEIISTGVNIFFSIYHKINCK